MYVYKPFGEVLTFWQFSVADPGFLEGGFCYNMVVHAKF